jgi:predicted RNA-binding protein YlxR (DUF448 family)
VSVPPPQRPAQPVRTCVGCRQRAAKAHLLRVVLDDRGAGREVVPDPGGRLPGRGAHLHPTPDCLQQALRRRAFTRALRAEPGSSSAPVEKYVRELTEQERASPAQHHPSATEKKLEQQLMSTR